MQDFSKTNISYNTGWLFSGPPPPNFTKSQAHYKFLDLENLGGAVQFIQGLGLIQIRGGARKKSHPVHPSFLT